MKKNKLILGISFAAMFGIGVTREIACHSTYVAHAEEISSTSDVFSENTQINNAENIEDKIKEAWDTYLVPLLSGVSITSVLSGILSIYFFIKNRKDVIKSNQKTLEVATNAITIITYANKIIEEIKTQNEISKQTKKEFTEAANNLLNNLNTLTNKTDDVLRLKEMIKTIGSIQAKIAMNSKELIASGIGEELAILEGYLKKL